MSTSGGGFAASGLLQGFAQSYTQARIRATEMEVAQRHGLASTLMQLYPNARPEAQQDIAQRLLSIYSTPPGKKLDKKIGDISSLGASAAQANNPGASPAGQQAAQGATNAQTASAQGQISAAPPPGAAAAAPPPSTPGIPPPPYIAASGAPGPQGVPLQGQTIPAPPRYSPLLLPEERNQQNAAATEAVERAKISGETKARQEAFKLWRDANPNAPLQEFLVQSGRGLPIGTFIPHTLSKNISGSDILQSNPDIVTTGGEKVDPKQFYDLTSIGGQSYAVPAGLGAQVALSGLNATPFKSYMNEGLKQGIPRADLINDWNSRQSVQHGYKMVPQPDGSIQMVPVTTVSENKRGQLPSPPGTPAKAGAGGGAAPGVGGPGRIVGGKLPPDVAKSQSTYLSSIERYNVMSSALPKALGGDQQAMINLLYNHIGMTVGLQKGARITQDIINEAQHSAPWMATILARVGVGNEFTMTPNVLRGVVIPPESMHNMIGLAEDRVTEDYNNFLQTKQAYSGGGVPTPEDVRAGGAARQSGIPTPPKAPSKTKPNVPAAAAAPTSAPADANNPLGI